VKFSRVVSIQIFSLKNANPSINEIHVENNYFPWPSKFKMLYHRKLSLIIVFKGMYCVAFTKNITFGLI
jgi:hypothetical protein